ncbi:MAG: type II toxin-antitoxin system PemK/MazF family toxin [Clostridiales bacterium]|jgi:hypothetical protein|nr:type II toxin-antitoxin system PemK/MazF family toxin [Clostridiales bacterium]
MPIDKRKLGSFKKDNPGCIKDEVNSNEFIKNQLRYTLNDTNRLMSKQEIISTIPYLFWNDFMNSYGIYADRRDQPANEKAKLRYARGRKVFVDFGCSSIGKETALPHPAFILYNFAETAIVVPTTSDDGSTFTPEMEKALIRCKGDMKVFPHDTIINLHQIRVISKNRIINDLGCGAEEYVLTNEEVDFLNKETTNKFVPYNINLKDCIELKIAQLYCPSIFYKTVDLENKIREQQTEIEKLKELLMQKENEIHKY